MQVNPKLKLTSSQNDFIETSFSRINDKYFFSTKIYIKTGNPNEFEEKEISDVPDGLRKYIKNKLKLG